MSIHSNLFFRLKKYISYRIKALGPHSLHSPSLYGLYTSVIRPSRSFQISKIESLRKSLHENQELLEITDFKTGKTKIKTVSSVAKSSASRRRFSAFLKLLIDHLNIGSVLETGTSFGLNTLYLAQSKAQTIVTIEGSQIISRMAQKHFHQLNARRIRLINDDIYHSLEQEIVRNKPEFYFLDADHRSSSIAFCIDLILKHTPNARCIVIHDIYWSQDMSDLWQQLTEDPRFLLTVDLFQAGILFPHVEMPKQHFTLRF